jgi:glutathione S-transferase
MLTIIGKTSSINVRKVLWTCTELALPFRSEDWHASHAPLNPNRMVPVLVDGDFVLWESNTICRYLCQRAGAEGAALLPSAAQARARVEQWMDWQATELNTAWRYAFMALVRASALHTDPQQIAASVARWNALVGLLDTALAASGAWLAGERFTLADIVIGLSLNRWLLTPIARPDYPHVTAYLARLAQRPGYLAWCANGVP